MALQYKQIEQQDAAIKSQTMLNQAEAAKALAEAGKTAGPEYNKATWEARNLEIENRIKTIAEGVTAANLTESEANAQKAVAEWNSAMAKAEVDQATKGTAIQTMKQNLINMQAEGALKIVGKDLSVSGHEYDDYGVETSQIVAFPNTDRVCEILSELYGVKFRIS